MDIKMMKKILLTFLLLISMGTTITYAQFASDLVTGGTRQQAGKGLNLVSFTIGKFKDGDNLIQIPNIASGNKPEVVVTSEDSITVIKPLTLRSEFFQASWSSKSLKQKISDTIQLFATALVMPKGLSSNPVYVPVIVDQKSEKYEFAFLCVQCQADIKSITVKPRERGGTNMSCKSVGNSSTPRFLCDGKNSKSGKYQVSISANVKLNGESQPQSNSGLSYNFQHDPQWFK